MDQTASPSLPALVRQAPAPAAPDRRIILAQDGRPARAIVRGQASPAPADRAGPGGVYAKIPERDDRGRDQLSMFRAWNPDPIGQHERNLAAIRPELAAVVRKALADHPGLRFVVGSGVRTPEEQQVAARWGWSPGRRRGAGSDPRRKHIEGAAVDLWPLDRDGLVTFAPAELAAVAAAMKRASRALGVPILWGGEWRSRRKDLPHFQLRTAVPASARGGDPAPAP